MKKEKNKREIKKKGDPSQERGGGEFIPPL